MNASSLNEKEKIPVPENMKDKNLIQFHYKMIEGHHTKHVGDYLIGRTIGHGKYSKVKYGIDTKTNKGLLKIFAKNFWINLPQRSI